MAALFWPFNFIVLCVILLNNSYISDTIPDITLYEFFPPSVSDAFIIPWYKHFNIIATVIRE